MRLAREEVFGPVLAVIRFRTTTRRSASPTTARTGWPPASGPATSAAPSTWPSGSRPGTVYVNTYRHVSTLSPAGGYKQSGYGRENGVDAIKEFLQVKSVWIGLGNTPNPFPT